MTNYMFRKAVRKSLVPYKLLIMKKRNLQGTRRMKMSKVFFNILFGLGLIMWLPIFLAMASWYWLASGGEVTFKEAWDFIL
ncbi:MAG TPA: hypothetical protein VMR76_01405 [Candidatus Saccharimonadia bacterium]|nr:hypothetical protein [Candidatus Saccharimonadia bacterium]